MPAQNPGTAGRQQRAIPIEKLSLLDVSFLYAETANVPMNIAGLQRLDVPEDRFGTFFQFLRDDLEDRVHLVPFMTRRLKSNPLGLDHPIWVRDENFDIDEHVKRIRLPPPGTPQQLEKLVARLHEKPLDRNRPLWEFWLIEGLESGQFAWYTKYQHAFMDGVAGQAVVDILCSDTSDTLPVPKASHGSGDRYAEDPALLALLWDTARAASQQRLRTLSALPDVASAAWCLGERALVADQGLGALLGPHGLNVAVGPGFPPRREHPADLQQPLSFVDVPERAYIDGVLAIYELNRIELLRDVFVWAYERPSARYSAVRQSLGEPDPFRLRHRALVVELVAAVVRAGIDRRAATALARHHAAERVPPVDRARFVEAVETEIMSLHEGNIARYCLRPVEYQACRQGWRWM